MFETLTSGISGAAGQATAWLLTYALHSTLFLSLAWLASRRLSRWSRLEEAVWRFALLAGLVTATVQLAAGREPLAGRWTLEAPARTVAVVEMPRTQHAAPLQIAERRVAEPVRSSLPVSVAAPAWRIDLRTAVLGLWAAGALLLAMRWGWSYLRLRRRLRARPEVIGGGLFSILGRLSGEQGMAPLVRLTCSSRVSVPVALGVLRPEICVPPRALSHLEPEQQEGMLAHELAHLVRRDPFWLAFSRLLSSVLFFQPLNRVAGRRLRELSERLCDEWAVERTGRPLSLARCLAEVAGWSVGPFRDLPVPSMADRPSSLAGRIRHLLDDARSPERRVKPLWLAVPMLAVLVGVAAVAPGVYAAAAEKPAARVIAEDREEAAEPELATADTDADDDLDEVDDLADVADVGDPGDLDDEVTADFEQELDRLSGEMDNLAELASGDELAGLPALAAMDEAFSQVADLDWDGGEPLSEADRARLEEVSERLAREAEEISDKYSADYEALADQINSQMEPELERISEQVNRELAPQIERISEQVNRDMAPEIERISQDVADRMSKLGPEIEKLHAEVDRLRKEGKLTEGERERIREQAREMARRARPSEEDLQALRDAQRKYREEMRKVMEEHRDEIEAARKEARIQGEALRDQMRRQLEADPKFRELRERHRQEMEQFRERHREEMRKFREDMRKEREERKDKEKPMEKEKEKLPAAA
ncbi:MAG TPA: M56 family metallopeptidase [Thermoanaerobaculia bacterium]|jgi:beta-lactamase regulating signal transducer with metallopeptidase domain|nr:M56 family metallopeptidase [Thermoanaerobaculia bacterium]